MLIPLFAVEELTVHGWDLAHGLGQDLRIDEPVAEWLVGPLAEVVERFAGSGYFAEAAGEVPAGVSAGERLLHLVGRRSNGTRVGRPTLPA